MLDVAQTKTGDLVSGFYLYRGSTCIIVKLFWTLLFSYSYIQQFIKLPLECRI